MKNHTSPATWILISALGIIPILFFPFIQDYYDNGKWIMLMASVTIVSVLGLIKLAGRQTAFHISIPPALYGFIALTIASFASLALSSSNKIEALLSPMGPMAFLSLTLILFTLSQLVDGHWVLKIKWLFFSIVSIVAVIAVYQFFGIGKSFVSRAPFLTDPLWTPAGSTTAAISLFCMAIPLLVQQLLRSFREKQESHLAILIVMMLITVSGLGITLYQFIPKISQTLLPLHTAWNILFETMKQPKYLLTGIGVENFLSAFNLGKPLTYNTSALWNVRFTTSASFFFHIATTLGLFGTAGCFILILNIFRKQQEITQTISLILAALSLLLFPPNLTTLAALLLLVLLNSPRHDTQITVHIFHNRIFRIAGMLVIITCLVTANFFLYKAVFAEMEFTRSLESAKANNGTLTYNLQVKSIQQNKYMSKYHIIYSQTNLALASSLAAAISQPDNKSTEDQKTKDRALVAQLVQQAIREAKIATVSNPTSVLAWENLARIYNQLIGVAQGADTWSETSYKRAIQLDPSNPILRLELGSIALKKKNYTDAITNFQKSASLKTNYANAYYNLANAYKASGDTDNALRALNQTQLLLDQKSADYETIRKEIENLKNPQQTP